MIDPSRPSKPLKILTLDGGGLQAASTLLILNKVLETIAQQNGVTGSKKPRPCDVFDTIVGIGAGGWLAILLGRFRMDITSCLTEWYNIMQCITPKSKIEQLRLRLLQHCYFDKERLVGQVDSLTKLYGTGDYLFEPDINGARTRHVFVAALNSDGKSYNLFRSYAIPESAKLPQKLLKGPKDPHEFKISSAFGVTGAARYFSMPWKEQIAGDGETRFSDTKFPEPHNITELALDEMWRIYGTDVPLSVIVNIGPGLPNDIDVKKIAKRFSWGLKANPAHELTSAKRLILPAAPVSPSDQDVKHVSDISYDDTGEHNRITKSTDGLRKRSVARTNTLGSIKDRGVDIKLRRREDQIENDIKKKLEVIQPRNSDLYFRLAPAEAPQGTPQSDFSASDVALNETLDYLSQPLVGAKIEKLVERIPEVVSGC